MHGAYEQWYAYMEFGVIINTRPAIPTLFFELLSLYIIYLNDL